MEVVLFIAGVVIVIWIAAKLRQSRTPSGSKPRSAAGTKPASKATVGWVINKGPFDKNFSDDVISIIDEPKTENDIERAYRLATPGMTPARRKATIAHLMQRHSCTRGEAIRLALADLRR